MKIKSLISKLRSKKVEAWNVALTFTLVAAIMMVPDSAFATADIVASTICNIVTELQGPIARGVAAFGIIFLGFSLFLGKITWGTALALGIGVGAVFGANEIVGVMSGDDACTPATTTT